MPDANHTRDEMADLLTEVPEAYHGIFTSIVELTDAFCDSHLSAEYRELCRDMAVALCQMPGSSPASRGKPASWASGIVHALGWVNFLSDPDTQPYMAVADIAKAFGVSPGTMTSKSKILRDGLNLDPMDPDWCLENLLEHNPLVWLLETADGYIIDIRDAPRPMQQEALRLGLIPFLPPAEDGGAEADADTEP